jgi:hypothetical protein
MELACQLAIRQIRNSAVPLKISDFDTLLSYCLYCKYIPVVISFTFPFITLQLCYCTRTVGVRRQDSLFLL